MIREPDMATIRAWTRLLRAQQNTLSRVEAALKRADLPPLSWYDALLELEKGPENGLRPRELEEKLLLPQYGLSRLLDRLEKAGYVVRKPVPEDGRAQRITLTPEGRHVRKEMWPVYAEAIEAVIADPLDEEERTVLSILLGKLIGKSG